MIRIVRFTAGAIAGLFDLAGNLTARSWVLDRVAYTGDTMNGFDLTAGLYAYHPKRLPRWFITK